MSVVINTLASSARSGVKLRVRATCSDAWRYGHDIKRCDDTIVLVRMTGG